LTRFLPNRKGRDLFTPPRWNCPVPHSGPVPNPSLTARAAQLVPCEAPPRGLSPNRAWCCKT
jgi:hypothetical protein